MAEKLQNSNIINYASTESILESISDGVFTVDSNWRISSFNRAAEEILGINRENAIGQICSEVFRSSMCEGACALKETLETGIPVINKICYIIDADGEQIPISVSTAVLKDAQGNIVGGAETFRDLSELENLRRELGTGVHLGDIVSRSPKMRKVFDLAQAVAASSSTVLIQGATGTGKELLARAIHNISPRADKKFLAVNCGALPDNLLESELFGYKKGAFTGAVKDKPGRFALADKGTIFLDEIGEISPVLQVKLLRVLQERCFEPLGATSSEHTDVRIIAATNRDLAEMVKAGTFREDLFYRINIIRIDLPPLKQRQEDIPLLVEHFVQRFNRLQGKNISGITPQANSLLMLHDWPGNIRELENVIERAFILFNEEWISPLHLPEELTQGEIPEISGNLDLNSARNLAEKEKILAALKQNNYKRLATARQLGIHKTTLFRKMKKLNIDLK